MEGLPQKIDEKVLKPPNCPFRKISYIFIIAGLELKILFFKSSYKQHSFRFAEYAEYAGYAEYADYAGYAEYADYAE